MPSTKPASGSPPPATVASTVTLRDSIVILHYGLKQLGNTLSGLVAVEQLLRVRCSDEDDGEMPDLSHIDRYNLCQLLALVGDAVRTSVDSLTGIAASAEHEALQ